MTIGGSGNEMKKTTGTPRYEAEVKQAAIDELLSGTKRIGQICRDRGIDVTTLRRWRREYAPRDATARSPLAGQKRVSDERARLREAERVARAEAEAAQQRLALLA